jgi:hypothetical protein
MFNCSVRVKLGDGDSARFWTDAQLLAGRIKAFAPHLFQAVGKRFLKTSVKDAIFQHKWVCHIFGALTVPVLYEYLDLWDRIRLVQLRPLVADRFVRRWTPDGTYSASSSYRSFFLGMSSLLGAREVWRASAPPKVKFFFWLALHRRLWTADCRRRHGLQDSAECALYGQEDETVDHLFASCVFAREVWFRVLHPSGWDPLSPTAHSPLSTWWSDGRSTVPAQLRRGFDSAVLLVSWRL